MKKDVSERFWEKVDTSGGPDACWEWQRAKDKWGYGHFKFYIDGKFVQLSHRVAYYLANNELPADLCVCHRCDNPACCNPQHLFLGTVAENNLDMLAKGRTTRGEKNAAASITEDCVRTIRAMFNAGIKRADIAQELGISLYVVKAVVSGKRWGFVE